MRKAWGQVEVRLTELAARLGGTPVPVKIVYDPLPGESVIDELPDVPKSSRPEVVPVSVRLRVTYRLPESSKGGTQ